MSSLHAVKREHQAGRIVQAKKVMPLIGPLLDAWDAISNDTKGIVEYESDIGEIIGKINAAMEGSPEVEDTPLA
jgi:hypothetical protein